LKAGPPVPIKYPTLKQGAKRVANPAPAPKGGRGPIKAKLSGAKVEKAVSLADQLAAQSKKLAHVEPPKPAPLPGATG
jgi:hypothetical protein